MLIFLICCIARVVEYFGIRTDETILGNKILLEKSINIRASDYRFSDKKKYYNGFTNDKGKYKEGTRNTELVMMAKQKDDFCEEDIVTRKKAIIDAFIGYLEQNMLTIG